jgi:MFS family permease
VSGFFGLCGSIGILIATKIGGILFDSWMEAGPFVLFAIFNAILFVWAVVIWGLKERFRFSNATREENLVER